jgi:hypothetical protein
MVTYVNGVPQPECLPVQDVRSFRVLLASAGGEG